MYAVGLVTIFFITKIFIDRKGKLDILAENENEIRSGSGNIEIKSNIQHVL